MHQLFAKFCIFLDFQLLLNRSLLTVRYHELLESPKYSIKQRENKDIKTVFPVRNKREHR